MPTYESIQSLKPAILSIWLRALHVWAIGKGMSRNPVDVDRLNGVLENVFLLMEKSDYPLEKSRRESPPLDCYIQEAFTRRPSEPLCLGLYETGLKAIQSVLESANDLRHAHQDWDTNRFQELAESALRTAVHLEIEGCVRVCAVENCPFR